MTTSIGTTTCVPPQRAGATASHAGPLLPSHHGSPVDQVLQIPIGQIRIAQRQARLCLYVDSAGIARLQRSIEDVGRLLTPIMVRPLPDGSFELVSGYRRLLAVREIGWGAIDALVRSLSDSEALTCALTDSLAAEPLSVLEAGWALEHLQQHLRDQGAAHSNRALRAITGATKSGVSQALTLARGLPYALLVENAGGDVQMVATLIRLPRRLLLPIARAEGEPLRRSILARVVALLRAGRRNSEIIREVHRLRHATDSSRSIAAPLSASASDDADTGRKPADQSRPASPEPDLAAAVVQLVIVLTRLVVLLEEFRSAGSVAAAGVHQTQRWPSLWTRMVAAMRSWLPRGSRAAA
jgi:ParB/RepB/Spo0J family partition protein